MGEIAEDTLNGLMCQACGCWMPEVVGWFERDDIKAPLDDPFVNPPGYPRICEDCIKDYE
jgi:hypothetical protein